MRIGKVLKSQEMLEFSYECRNLSTAEELERDVRYIQI